MDKILDIQEIRKKLQDQKEKKIKQERLQAIQGFLQCAFCSYKCAMCGIHTDNELKGNDPSFEYPLCGSCREEFKSYMEVAEGKTSDILWHNTEWFEMWSAWIQYRKSLKRFLDSPECRLLYQ